MRTRTFLRLTAVLLLTLVFSARVFTPALAAAPANDDGDNAIVLGFPDSATGSTLEAMAGPDDWLGCGSGPSIWYQFTGAGATIQVNTFGSDFDTVLSAFAGTPYDYAFSCNDDFNGIASALEFYAESGVTYYFMVNGYGGGSGNVVISTVEPPPPPIPFSFELAVDSATVNARTGVVTLGGTVTCTTAGWVNIYMTTTQRVGRALIHGSGGYANVTCDETGPVRWSLQESASDGIFKGGGATVAGSAYGQAFDWRSGEWYTELAPTNVRLRGER